MVLIDGEWDRRFLTKTTCRKVVLQLVGLDGNAFNLLGHFQRAAREQGWLRSDIEAIVEEATKADYGHLLRVLIEHTEPPNDES